uniref:Uncharacterized protein n=1 Tax=Fibrocapsa japonica TaxID=94617 RepID=A0A7S2V2U5_9STRA|mmetsp:Transcript_4526/g.6780  ORF Transcript_4526/g.6780 Transcript_4526/m.6780 type:complete len:391 (+) Transcript_4526:92-1264(+)
MGFFSNAVAVLLLYSSQCTATIASDFVNIVWGTIDIPKLPNAISDHTCTTYEDKIYLIGGCDSDKIDGACTSVSNSIVEFDTTTGFSTLLSFDSVSNPLKARHRHAAVLVGSEIYLFGGRDVNDNIVTQIEKFNPSTMEFSEVGDWAEATSDLAGFEYSGRVYLAGGYGTVPDDPESCEDYCAHDEIWEFRTTLKQVNLAGRMEKKRADFAFQGPAEDGYYYAVGGYSHQKCDPLSSVEQFHPSGAESDYNPNDDNTVRSLTTKRGGAAATVLNEKIHMIGGETKIQCEPILLTDIEIYNTDEDQWVTFDGLPTIVSHSCAASYDNSVYIFGGQTALHDLSNTYPLVDTAYVYSEIIVETTEANASPGLQGGLALTLFINIAGFLLWAAF